ncbi:adenine phosphoribosyltransferase [Oceanitalea stevensii]|uniref:Adenine phosphoribosyltransferase n=1 Tax=Oceanitalea stevensii TaxID=2763072 RepID=A0ABR8YZ28_9MICO|nr:adenine phosphoribosyltransferase [Oceanitalea stevensii]MBD8061239.1 adenine phosphoribosyltransferase [Oceanitalea stevensii]
MTDFPEELTQLLDSHVREVPDFPEPGVLFRDITPLLADGPAFAALVDALAERYRGKVDAVAGLESRGFILAAPLAHALGVGMITIRKAGRLPGPVTGVDYTLEYGTARLELRPETVTADQRVLIIDDVLATGGTARAAIELIEGAGARVAGLTMLLELDELRGREQLTDYPLDSILRY